jgi:hypothetical protein
VRGPNNYGRKDVWSYRASRFEHCQAIVVMLWPFLSQQKRGDVVRALTSMREWFAEKAATCRHGLHNLAEVGLTSVGSCAECDRENRRAKYAAAKQPAVRKMRKSGKHEMTPANTYTSQEAHCCRACRAANKRGVSGHREKRERVAAALKEDASRSNRELARLLGVSHGLVGRVRNAV